MITCRIACLIAAVFVMSACQSASPTDSPSPSDATTELSADDINPMHWVTYSRQLMADREAGVERLLAEDARAFWRDCAVVARQIDDWPMIRLLCEKASASRATDALPWLIRSWAMPSQLVSDTDRPERHAIDSIAGKPADEVLKKIIFAPMAEDEPVTQIAAWTVLVRTESEARIRALIDDSSADVQRTFLAAIRRVAPAVDVLPKDRLGVAQLMHMVLVYDQAQWLDWSRWRERHHADGPASLALRHLPAISNRDLLRDDWSRSRWLSHIEKRLVGRRFVSRGEGAGDDIVVQQRPERFADHAHALGLADLIVLDHLLNAMNDPAFRGVAFDLAEADRLDETTEFGGAVVWDTQGKPVLKPFAPLLRRHDQAYIASTSCLEAVYRGLAHVHFHAQQYDTAVWAGPGQGDLDFVEAHQVNAIVLTFIDRDTLNLDVAMPGGVIIDLGCMTR